MYSTLPVKEDDHLLQRHEKQSLSVSERRLSGEPLDDESSGDCCGLNSSDSQIKQSSRLKFCFGCFAFLAILLPLMFLVIIPEITQGIVDDSDLVILEANIINPNDISFQSKVIQKLSGVEGTHGTLQMHKLTLQWNDGTGNKKLASLTQSNEVDITTGKVTLKSQANVKDVEALSLFNLFAISADKFQWKIKGTATVETSGLTIPVDVDKTVDMIGFNNFPVPPVIEQINITNGSPTVITNEILATFTNDANIAISFGQAVEFTLKSEGITIGTGVIPDLYLKTGVFPVAALGYLSATAGTTEYTQLMRVISNFTTGLPSPVSMGPFKATATIQWLEAGLASMNLLTAIPGLTEKLITSVDMYPDGTLVIPFQMNMKNPIDTVFRLSHITATIFSSGIAISTIDADVDITIPPRTAIVSPLINANAIYSPAALQELGRLEAVGTGLLNVRSTLIGAINEFPTESQYSQDNVPATIHHQAARTEH